nr:MAG TPA: hypothetical protein [Crassvirales sp.]
MCTCTRCLIPARSTASFQYFNQCARRILLTGTIPLKQPFLRTVLFVYVRSSFNTFSDNNE